MHIKTYPSQLKTIFQHLSEIEAAGIQAALCTIVGTKGSTPRKPGSRMIVFSDGSIAGTVGGGQLEVAVISQALEVLKTGQPQTLEHALVHDHGMCCGGSLQIFIEPIIAMKQLYIFGAGHIGKSLARFANELNFKVTLIDERPEAFENFELVDIQKINKSHRVVFDELKFDENTFAVVVTHDHSIDREIVAHCAKQPHAYLGMIGSLRKVELAKKTFRAGEILTEQEMEKIDWPMGVSIKVETPEEIAISILAKLIDVRNGWNTDDTENADAH